MRWSALLLLGLAGCQTPAEMIEASRCESYGYRKGTPNYGACMEQQANRRLRASMALIGAGTAMMQSSQPTYVTPQQPVNITVQQPRTVCTQGPYGVVHCR